MAAAAPRRTSMRPRQRPLPNRRATPCARCATAPHAAPGLPQPRTRVRPRPLSPWHPAPAWLVGGLPLHSSPRPPTATRLPQAVREAVAVFSREVRASLGQLLSDAALRRSEADRIRSFTQLSLQTAQARLGITPPLSPARSPSRPLPSAKPVDPPRPARGPPSRVGQRGSPGLQGAAGRRAAREPAEARQAAEGPITLRNPRRLQPPGPRAPRSQSASPMRPRFGVGKHMRRRRSRTPGSSRKKPGSPGSPNPPTSLGPRRPRWSRSGSRSRSASTGRLRCAAPPLQPQLRPRQPLSRPQRSPWGWRAGCVGRR